MTTALSLHLGLNEVSPVYYGSSCKLNGCINDANSMSALASKLGYKSMVLTNQQATKAAITNQINTIAKQLNSGDIFLLTYSGHGSQVFDKNSDESDGLDETWCLFDGEFIDDDLYKLWSRFRAGVRLVVISDSCHSGTVAKGGQTKIEQIISKDIDCVASGILLSGCRDSQVSYDTNQNGLFTSALLQVWNDGKFVGSYSKFLKDIAAKLVKVQSPNYFTFGAKNMKFYRQKPFTI